MKGNAAQNNLSFSAYPLKVLKQEVSASSAPPQAQSTYLKALLNGKTRAASRVRVFPLVNPYPGAMKRPVTPKESKLPKDIELTERDWFNNYE